MKRQDADPVHPSNGGRNGGRNEGRHVDGRSSGKQADVRHAKLYDTFSDTTIRAVTPDSAASAEITALPSPSSFPTQTSIRFQPHDPAASVSNTDEESVVEKNRKKVKKKPKYKDPHNSDTSPSSFFEKTRKRLNSITTASTSAPRQDDPTLSIGFPSVVQPSAFPDMHAVGQQLPRTPRRTFSSDAAVTTTASAVRSPLMLESDADKILKLMKTLCGRMHGILFYRPIGTTSWHSGYCAINVAPGSLVAQTRGDPTQADTLIPDLRGCTVRTHYDPPTQTTHLSVVLPVSGLGYELRPSVPETFESWLAALLCWQPLKPKGVLNKLAKPQPISTIDKPNASSRRLSDMSSPRSTAVVKSSQMLLWDGALPAGSYRHPAKRFKSGHTESTSWRRVNCTLHEDGNLRLLAEEGGVLVRSLKLGNLARCAIQRLDQSVLGVPHCIAIHPQYTINPVHRTPTSPLVVSLSTRIAFEAWFVLLLAMTVPELYGPEGEATSANRPQSRDESNSQPRNMFRIERSLSVRIVEAKFSEDWRWRDQQAPLYANSLPSPTNRQGADIYADVLLGRDLRARTVNKPFSHSIFWAEEFLLAEIPSMLSRLSVILKMGTPDEKEWTMTHKGEFDVSIDEESPNFESIEVASHDPVYGRVDVPLYDLEPDKFVERWWPLHDHSGVQIGSALIKLKLEEKVVLMEAEYAEVSRLLHSFNNSLTSQLGQVLGIELKILSDILLDIFQVSGHVEEWIENLVEEEIDGIYREQPPSVRMRFSGRIHSNDSYESAEHRELLVRDLSRSATLEANLLFRGNSLVTKAIDSHMRRLGQEYLENTLGEKLRSIVSNNPNCEVDPNRITSSEQLEKNWSNLIAHTSSIWQAIGASAARCPNGIKQILKHVSSCAEDRYGSFIRTIKYTSVSSFLFLRLFCPAILNPKLFHLLDDHPQKQQSRTFTLIAKSLMGLANLQKFGQKESWMEPMNKFLTIAIPEFKVFIDELCSYSSSQGLIHEAQYQAAFQVKQRLPPSSREGLPSLPFLLDTPRSYATLVDLWVDNAPANLTDTGVDDAVQSFHAICNEVHQRTTDCFTNAEVAQEPNTKLERQWQKMLSEQPKGKLVPNPFDEMYTENNEITALPQPSDIRKYSSRHAYTSRSSAIGEGEELESPQEGSSRVMTTSTNSSNVSLEVFDEYRKRQAGRSREGPSRGRYLEISNQRRGRNEQSPGADANRF